MRYQSLWNGRLWNDRGKVRTNRNALVFGDAISNSTDPLVTLLRVLKDGKLGTLPVDNNTLKLTEYVSGNEKFNFAVFWCIHYVKQATTAKATRTSQN